MLNKHPKKRLARQLLAQAGKQNTKEIFLSTVWAKHKYEVAKRAERMQKLAD